MKKLMFLMLAIVFFTQCNKGNDTNPATKFKVTLNKADKEYYSSVTPTADGYLVTKGLYANGYTTETILFDKEGVIKSSNKVSNSSALIFGSTLTQNGDCIAWGSTVTPVNGKNEESSVFFRIDSKGSPLWVKKIASNIPITFSRWEYVANAVEMPDKRIFLMGSLENDVGLGNFVKGSYMSSLSETGDILWFKKSENAKFYPSLIAETDGSVVAAYGSYNPSAPGVATPKLDKYDANGNVLWSRSLSGSNNNWVSTVKIDANYYVVASNESTYAVRLSKANANGELTVVKTYGNLNSLRMICKTADNNLLIFGYDGTNPIMVKVDTAGNELWRKSLPARTQFFDAKLCTDGGFILLTGSSSGGNIDIYNLLKTDSEGNFE